MRIREILPTTASIFPLVACLVICFPALLPAQEEGRMRLLQPAVPDSQAPESTHAMLMLRIQGGKLRMGCTKGDPVCAPHERPPRWVQILPFEMDQHEVTNGDFLSCVKAGACRPVKESSYCTWRDPAREREPMACVTWEEARDYCTWARKRLPSEAEWEWAARSGTSNRLFSWGNEYDWLHSNGLGVGGRDQWLQASPIGSFPPNSYGLVDMEGNVSEWVEDCYHDGYLGAPKNQSAWTREGCPRRVIRGGSWRDDATLHRVSARLSAADKGEPFIGFRCARTISTPE